MALEVDEGEVGDRREEGREDEAAAALARLPSRCSGVSFSGLRPLSYMLNSVPIKLDLSLP